jgi:GNAT superfamily N-acetyltransferase
MWNIVKLDRKVHDRASFDCGVPELNLWLKTQSAQKMDRHLVNTWVATPADEPRVIAGYMSLAPHHITIDDVPESFANKVPREGLFCVILPRLAVDLRFRRKGLGEVLLGDAILRARTAAEQVPYLVLVVDAKDDGAKRFYQHMQMTPFSPDSMRLYVVLH